MEITNRNLVDGAMMIGALLLLGWAGYAQFVVLPGNRAVAEAVLATPHISASQIDDLPLGSPVSISGVLGKSGAQDHPWIAYVSSRWERDTRASAPTQYRWVVDRIEKPAELELIDLYGETIPLRAAVEDYALESADNEAQSNSRILGFKSGRNVTVIGTTALAPDSLRPGAIEFTRISGQEWDVIKSRHEDTLKATTPGIIVLSLAGLGLLGGLWLRNMGR